MNHPKPYKGSGDMPSGSFWTETTITAEVPLTDEQTSQVLACVTRVVVEEVAAKCAPLRSRSNHPSDRTMIGMTKTYEISEGLKITVKIDLRFNTQWFNNEALKFMNQALDQLHTLLHALPEVWTEQEVINAN